MDVGCNSQSAEIMLTRFGSTSAEYLGDFNFKYKLKNPLRHDL